MSATMIKRTALYRLYDANDALLYVGITYHPTERFAQHRKESHWWHQVARREVTWHEHRPAAQDAEKRAIQVEEPKWNETFSLKNVVALKWNVSAPDGHPYIDTVPFDLWDSTAREPFIKYLRRMLADCIADVCGVRPDASALTYTAVDGRRATGYSRETIRQALNPEIRAKIKAKRTGKAV